MTTWIRAGVVLSAHLLLLLGGQTRAGEVNVHFGSPYSGCTSCGPPAASGCTSCGAVAAAPAVSSGSTGDCHSPKVPCPPPYCHVVEGPPCLKYKHGCPRPVCDPCHLEHFGYYPTCWSPWPYPPNWKHCPYPTASVMLPAPHVPPFTPKLAAPRPFMPEPARTEPSRTEKQRTDPDKRDSEKPVPKMKRDLLSPPTPAPTGPRTEVEVVPLPEVTPAVRLIR